MTLLFADGFEDGLSAWAVANGSFTIGTGRFGNGAVAASNVAMDTGLTPSNSVIGGMAFKPNGAGAFMGFMDTASGFAHVGLSRGTGGEIVAHRGNAATISTTAGGVIPIGAWSYIELKTTIHDTTGILVIRVNGVEVLNITGVDTRSSGSTTNTFRAGAVLGSPLGVGPGGVHDDIYICDATGTFNNNFLGEVMVEHLRPASDDTSQWIGSDGNSVNNWDLVDEIGTPNTADYVASSTVGQRDLYLPTSSSRPASNPVRGVMVSAVVQKTDAGTRTAKLMIREGAGGTERQSSELGLPTSFGELRAMWDRKADGTTWSVADVNALRFGIEVTA